MLQIKLMPYVFVFILSSKLTTSSNILGIFTAPSKSNHMIYNTLMEELAIRGHNVTVASTYRDKSTNISNYKYIYIQMNDEKNFTEHRHEFFQQNAKTGGQSLKELRDTLQKYSKHSFDFLHLLQIDKLKQNQRFDLVIIGYALNDFFVGIPAHFECPSIVITANQANIFTNTFIGNPSSVSHNPSILLGYTNPMTLKQRIVNYFVHILAHIFHFAIQYIIMEPYYTELFPPHLYPSYNEAKKNVSLVLFANQHFTDGIPVATMPNQIYVGALSLQRRRNELPQDIKNVMDSATDGVIYFSLGTNLNSSNLPKDTIDILIKQFSQLKQKILWKWEDDQLDHKSDNIFISKWLPQVDVLAHFNTKLFISHCGLGSIIEAKFYGIPILCISFFGDQYINLQTVCSEGWGMGMQFSNFNKLVFSEQLNRVLSDGIYDRRAKELSQLIRDQPMDPMETAIYWVEYVIRHKGAKHLKSPGLNLNFFIYNSFDVLAFLIFFPYVVVKWLFLSYNFMKKLKLIGQKVKVQ